MAELIGDERESDRRATDAELAEPYILVVEDEAGLLDIITVNLEAAGYRVAPTGDGMEALRQFEEARPALVILDLYLPGVSGFRLAELFKQDAPTVPILVMTALDFAEAEHLASLGIEAFVTKPFGPERVLRIVGDLMSRSTP